MERQSILPIVSRDCTPGRLEARPCTVSSLKGTWNTILQQNYTHKMWTEYIQYCTIVNRKYIQAAYNFKYWCWGKRSGHIPTQHPSKPVWKHIAKSQQIQKPSIQICFHFHGLQTSLPFYTQKSDKVLQCILKLVTPFIMFCYGTHLWYTKKWGSSIVDSVNVSCIIH